MDRVSIRMALAVMFASFTVSIRADVVYNVTNDYSSSINTNGVWTFGWQLEPALGSLPINIFDANGNASGGHANFNLWSSSSLGSGPFVGKQIDNADSGDQSGTLFRANQVAMHAGNSGVGPAAAVVRFTAPITSTYHIDEAIFEYRSDIPGNSVYVFNTGTKIFEETTDVRGTTDSLASQFVQLNAGDYLDFIVGSRSGATNSTTTQLNAVISQVTAVPEPSSATLLLLVTSAMTWIRYRKRA